MAAAEWIFLEGYRYDGPDSIAAFEKAVRAAKRAGGKVGDHPLRPLLRRAPPRRVPADDPRRRRPARRQRARAEVALPDRRPRARRWPAPRPRSRSPPAPSAPSGAHVLGRRRAGARRRRRRSTVVDATGAGDLFAAGFLHGLTTRPRLADLRAHGLPRGRRGHLATSAPGPRPTCARSSPTRGPDAERRRARPGRDPGRAAAARQPAARHRADDPDARWSSPARTACRATSAPTTASSPW